MTSAETIKRYIFQLSIHKTIYFNFRCFSFKTACKLPVFVNRGCKMISLKGKIIIDAPVSPGLIVFANGSSVDINGSLTFKGKARFGKRTHIYVGKNGALTIGDTLWSQNDVEINCNKEIIIGDHCLLSWDVDILDTDFHRIFENNRVINDDASIVLSDHVWIGCKTTILKGVVIAPNIIIGAGSLLNGRYDRSYSIYSGSPARLVKKDITWQG